MGSHPSSNVERATNLCKPRASDSVRSWSSSNNSPCVWCVSLESIPASCSSVPCDTFGSSRSFSTIAIILNTSVHTGIPTNCFASESHITSPSSQKRDTNFASFSTSFEMALAFVSSGTFIIAIFCTPLRSTPSNFPTIVSGLLGSIGLGM